MRRGGASAGDPLTGIFDAARPAGLAALSLVLLALAIPFRRFWCRALCPTGAALALLGALSPMRRRLPVVQPGRCDLGVERRDDPDCLGCDRCRGPRRPGERTPARKAGSWSEWLYPLAAALMAGWVIVYAYATVCREDAAAETTTSSLLLPSSLPTPPGADESGLLRLRELQRQGRLSDREARHYHPAAADSGLNGNPRDAVRATTPDFQSLDTPAGPANGGSSLRRRGTARP